jgi:hypothetical protein
MEEGERWKNVSYIEDTDSELKQLTTSEPLLVRDQGKGEVVPVL